MTSCQDTDHMPALNPRVLDQDLLEMLETKPKIIEQDYLKAYVPQPTTSFLHVSPDPEIGRSRFSAPTSLANHSISIGKGPVAAYKVRRKDLRILLKKLVMVLYYHQVQELVEEMNGAGADTAKQGEILGRLVEPLQLYSTSNSPTASIVSLTAVSAEAVEAAGAHPFELDPIRRGLCNLFDLPSVTTGKTHSEEKSYNPTGSLWSIETLTLPLVLVRRSIRKRGLEAFIYGAIDKFARQIIALAGRLSLIIPMIMMSFLTRRDARLIIVYCFVVGFSFLIGIFTRAQNQEVLAATAVYTAVLAVFV